MVTIIYDKPLRGTWHMVEHCVGDHIETVGRRQLLRRCPRCGKRTWSLRTFVREGGRVWQVACDLFGSWESICLFCDTRIHHGE